MLLLTLKIIVLYNHATDQIQDNYAIVNTQDNCIIQSHYC